MKFANVFVPASEAESVPFVALPDGRWLRLVDIANELAPSLGNIVGRNFQLWACTTAQVVHDPRDFLIRTKEWLDAFPSKNLKAHPDRYLIFSDKDIKRQNAYFLPPVKAPRAFRDFYAFEQHVKTARAKRGLEVPPAWYEAPAFYFSNPGTLIGHDDEVYAPRGSVELDYELELGIIIGQGGRDIPLEKAWEHVAGFTIINDFSARDIQRTEMSVGLGPAKGKDFATGVGPYLVTLDDFKDRIDAAGRLTLEMCARVNGKELSRGNARTMHFTWPQIIARASADAELFPGDLIGSGTVGTGCILELGPENTDGWLKPGDVVECEIERLGVLRHWIVNRPN